MKEKGHLVRTEARTADDACGGNEVFFDATNPDASERMSGKNQENYYDQVQNSSGWMWQEPEYKAFTISRTTAISSEAYRGREIFIRNII